MEVGYYALLSQATGVHIAAARCVIESQQECVGDVSAHVWSASDPADTDNFRSLYAKTFMTPETFEFQPHHADTVCTVISPIPLTCATGFRKKAVFKKAQSCIFGGGVYWVCGFIGFFRFFYLIEQLGSLLVDLAHQLSFYLYSPVL